MAKKPDLLNDVFLLHHCGQHLNKLTFLSSESLKDLKICIRNRKKCIPFGDSKSLKKLWLNLLIDSIHALKVKDGREKASKQRFDNRNLGKRNKARVQNAYGISELGKYFDSFSQFERILYGSEANYRDHFLHIIRVWLIGLYLLSSFRNRISNIHIDIPSDIEELKQSDISDEERWAIWTVIALCHDLGYPLQITHQINEHIDEMLSFFGNISIGRYQYTFQTQHRSLNEITLKYVSSRLRIGTNKSEYSTNQQAKYYAKFAHSFEEMKHGMMSCLVLMKTLVYFMETDYDAFSGGRLNKEDARQFQIRNEILRAIASHTCSDIYHLQLNTFQFLLILCDELQQWDRPTFEDMRYGRGALGKKDTVEVKVASCKLKDHGEFIGKISPAKVDDQDKVMEEIIRNRFRLFHKLLRAAINDATRKFRFEWQYKYNKNYCFKYDSSSPPFEELEVTRNGKNWLVSLFKEKKG